MSKVHDSSDNRAVRIALPPSRSAVPPLPIELKPKQQLSQPTSTENTQLSAATVAAVSQQPIKFFSFDTEVHLREAPEVIPLKGEEIPPFLVYLVLAASLIALGFQVWILL